MIFIKHDVCRFVGVSARRGPQASGTGDALEGRMQCKVVHRERERMHLQMHRDVAA
jgi:hypothetical protein